MFVHGKFDDLHYSSKTGHPDLLGVGIRREQHRYTTLHTSFLSKQKAVCSEVGIWFECGLSSNGSCVGSLVPRVVVLIDDIKSSEVGPSEKSLGQLGASPWKVLWKLSPELASCVAI
jgi:hypothetical protein